MTQDPTTTETPRASLPPVSTIRVPVSQPHARPEAASVKRRGLKPVIFGLLAAAVIGAGGYEGYQWWTTGRFMVSTDDAYVDADITLISSRVQGYVTDLAVQANDRVAAGDVLIRLDDGDYRNALETAKSRVATAGLTLQRIDAQITAAKASVAEAEAMRDSAQAQLRNAQTTLTRVQGLSDRKVVAQAQLDAAIEDFETATAEMAKARAFVASAEAQVAVLQAERAESDGARRALDIAVDQAQRDLDLTVLRAPVDGVIANLAIETGDLVSAGVRLAALVPQDGLYVEANFKETQMDGIVPGSTVHLSFDALPGQDFASTVASASPATGAVFSLLPADNATGNFTKVVQRVPVRINVPDAALATGGIRAGLSVTVEVDSRTGGAAATKTADIAALAAAQ
ncbi:HlyD family secretion protein [Pseudoruegeria sp. SK021]|uniref:HlyD family secretion protein n=1 Tax=Pseudoruegeria sp. SK021 TaxID=1933035 RepID=UPI000A23D5DD|nr:HlyD family secretion protein [Pseudoruegeria sp. SK021]OSP54980.1 hemolysin D [Pseudoruegeria sp. SK021]